MRKLLISSALILGAPAAQALPLGLDPAIATGADVGLKADNIRWVCGPYRCRWVPNYGIYGPRPGWGPRRYWGGPRWGDPRWGGPRWDRCW